MTKKLDYCTYEHRGIQIRNLSKYTLSNVGWEFYLPATEEDPITEHRIASSLREAISDIDFYLWDAGERVGA